MEIKFSHNWNGKLGNKIFTTIRNSSKAEYYGGHLYDVFEVKLNGEKICEAKLVDIWSSPLKDISSTLLMIDTSYVEKEKIYKLFKNFGINPEDTVIVLVFERTGGSVDVP